MWMSSNNELTSEDIKKRLMKTFGISVTKQYVNILRKKLGWSQKIVKYCQLISHKNKKARLDWCKKELVKRDSYEDVIYVDETSVEMSSTGRMFFYKPGSDLDRLPAKASRPKHSYKVNVFGGISYQGRTNICIFTGIMDSVIYQQILESCILPFVDKKFPNGYRLYQDNDSKHTSRSTKQWMQENGMLDKVMKTPASSPDLNPIENVWSALKDYLQRVVKPKRKEELVNGIGAFWENLSASQCGKYIDHVHRVIPQVILNSGGPTKF